MDIKFIRTACRNEKAPSTVYRQGAVSGKCPVLTGHGRESEAGGGTVSKNEEAPCLLGRGPRESSGDLLSRARGPGTIGDEGLDFRVRKGNGYDPLSVTAETIFAATTCCRKSPESHSLEAGGFGLLTQLSNQIVEKKEKALPGY